jgi:hypothetical protein
MVSGILDLLGPSALLVVAVLWLAIFAATVTLPFALWSIVGSLGRISKELRRMNDERAGAPVIDRAPEHVPEPTPVIASAGHRLLR